MDKKSNLNKFITFLENDFYRSLKVMIPTMVLLLIAHIGAAVITINNYKDSMNSIAKRLQQDVTTINGSEVGTISITSILRESNILQIMILSFVVIGLYTLVLWNREWRGSSKTSYTLLTLPFKKVYILISKILTIFIFLGINLIIQYSALFIDKLLINMMVSQNLIRNVSIFDFVTGVCRSEVTYTGSRFMFFLSLDIVTIILNIVLAMSLIILLGLIVLLFRSFNIKGGVLGTIIFITYILAYIFAPGFLKLYFYESIYFKVFMPSIISILGFIWSNHLLEKKVSV